MPQTSIRFYMVMIAFFALAMLIFQSAVEGPGWTRIAALLITTAIGCFATYAATFLVSHLFSNMTAPIIEVVGSSDPREPGDHASNHIGSKLNANANHCDQEAN